MLCSSELASGPALAQPVEIHCGDADGVTSPEACRRLADRLAASFHLIPGAGHASPVEQPEAVARLILRAALPSSGEGSHA